jgi:hypothetical protein
MLYNIIKRSTGSCILIIRDLVLNVEYYINSNGQISVNLCGISRILGICATVRSFWLSRLSLILICILNYLFHDFRGIV